MNIVDLKDRLIQYFQSEDSNRNRFLLPRQNNVFARRKDGCYTFMIPGGDYLNFYEEFNSCILETGMEGSQSYLYFSCRELSEEFITFCLTNFIPAEKREEITADPAAWFEKISSVFGNKLVATATSDKVAELYVFWQMKRFGFRNISFGGYNKKSLRDIQCEGFEVEVKSMLNHHSWTIHTNNEQIGQKKDGECYYVLCRLENADSLVGEKCFSLNSLKRELSRYSGTENLFEKLPKNTSLLDKIYIIREIKVFRVDENFPSVSLAGKTGGADLKNFVLDLHPDVLGAQSLDDFLISKGGIQPSGVVDQPVVTEEPAAVPANRTSKVGEFLLRHYGENITRLFDCQIGIPVYDPESERYYLYLPFAEDDNLIGVSTDGKPIDGDTQKMAEDRILQMQIATRVYDPAAITLEHIANIRLDGLLNGEIRFDQEHHRLFFDLAGEKVPLEWTMYPFDPTHEICWKDYEELKWFGDHPCNSPATETENGNGCTDAAIEGDIESDEAGTADELGDDDAVREPPEEDVCLGDIRSREELANKFTFRTPDRLEFSAAGEQTCRFVAKEYADLIVETAKYVWENNPDKVREVMQAQGYTNIACSENGFGRAPEKSKIVSIADECFVNTKLSAADAVQFIINLFRICGISAGNITIHLKSGESRRRRTRERE